MKIDGALVSTDWLADNLDNENLRIFDATVYLKPKEGGGGYDIEGGHGNWSKSHIPGAGFLDIVSEFSDGTTDVPFTMPPAEQFCALAAGHGVSDDSLVVLYSDGIPMWATRTWWMFRSVGFDNVVVLDGGWQKWQREGRPVSDAAAAYPAGNMSANARPEMWVDKDDMLRVMNEGGACNLNALSPDVYSGKIDNYGRAGHIPGSHNVFYGSLIDADEGTFLPIETLSERFRASGSLDPGPVVIY
jgi:thiosulfate/3-mercaptopyruvate sulfurtransferase